MSRDLTAGENNLILLNSLIPASEQFYLWAYDREGQCVRTSCPGSDRDTLEQFFLFFGGREKLTAFLEEESAGPLLVGSPIGLQWAVIPDLSRCGKYAVVMGPVFYSAPVESQLRAAIRHCIIRHRQELCSQFVRLAPNLPVLSYAIFTRYVILVHNALNGQNLGLGALDHGETGTEDNRPDPAGLRDRTAIYLSERAMLQMVRNGDLNYQEVFQKAVIGSPGVPVHGQDPLRQAKTSVIVFTSLVCRAAMEGGLSPDVAYSLGDSYIQSVEDCSNSARLSALALAMYHDFVSRVHLLRSNPAYSHAVQKCCDYIEQNLNKKIKTADLAALVGYTEYYLTEKFRKETGLTVSSYIRCVRVERAKLLLETTDMTVKEIAESLAFTTPNYFIQCFRETAGYTPVKYREKFKYR